MTAALVCMSVAVLMLPAPAANYRFRTVLGTESAVPQRRSPALADLTLVACVPLAAFGALPGAAALAIAAGTVRVRTRRRVRHRVQGAETRLLLTGLETVIAELRVGAHPADACAVAAQECAGSVAQVFRTAAACARLGGSAADGIRTTQTRVGPELERIASAWSVAERHGLALADLLEAARSDLLGRIRFRQRTEAALAGARATAAVLAGLPALGVTLGQLMGAAPLRVLLGGGLGGMLLVLGTFLACAGLLWTDGIVGRVNR